MPKKAYITPEPHQIKEWVTRTFPECRTRRNKKHGEVYLIDSPFIPGDSGHHVGILSTGLVRDFRPQYKSLHDMSFLRFVSQVEGINYGEAVKLICGDSLKSMMAKAKMKLRKDYKEEEEEVIEPPTLEIPSGLLKFDDKDAAYKHPKTWEYCSGYLNSREIAIEEATELDIFYNATGIYFLYKEYGQIVYWQKRSMISKEYEFPPITNEYLWGFDNAEPRSNIYITESMFNSGVIGYGALASGGAKLYPRQIRLIKILSPQSIILCPDHDDAGIKFLREAFYQLNPYYKLFYYLPPKGMDINDLAKKKDRINNRSIIRNTIDKEKKPLTRLTMIQATLNK